MTEIPPENMTEATEGCVLAAWIRWRVNFPYTATAQLQVNSLHVDMAVTRLSKLPEKTGASHNANFISEVSCLLVLNAQPSGAAGYLKARYHKFCFKRLPRMTSKESYLSQNLYPG